MSNSTLAQFLVLFMLFVADIRFMIHREAGPDSLSAMPLAALVVSVFNIVIFGVSVLNTVIFFTALWVFICNLRAFIGMLAEVIIDRYSATFIVFSLVNLVITGAVIGITFAFRPMDTKTASLDSVITEYKVSGNFEKGFTRIDQPFVFSNGEISIFQPPAEKSEIFGKDSRTIVLFIPPKTASARTYSAFMAKLAHDGYTVYCGEFFPSTDKFISGFKGGKFYRKYNFLNLRIKSKMLYEQILKNNRAKLAQEYEALWNEARPTEKDRVFLCGDEDLSHSMKKFYEDKEGMVMGYFDLEITEYGTTGFGPVENTDPMMAWVLKKEPDRTGYLSSHIALEVEDFISSRFLTSGE